MHLKLKYHLYKMQFKKIPTQKDYYSPVNVKTSQNKM